jgi:hypothetical protein
MVETFVSFRVTRVVRFSSRLSFNLRDSFQLRFIGVGFFASFV